MSYPMRRVKQALSEQECQKILRHASSGVLAVCDEQGCPYSVPLSFVYDADALYFHCARSGHKLEALKANPNASFCVIDQDEVIPETYTTWYRSVIVFGRIEIMDDPQAKREAICRLAMKYAFNDSQEHRNQAIDKDWDALCMLKMTIERISGKEAIELVRRRQQNSQ